MDKVKLTQLFVGKEREEDGKHCLLISIPSPNHSAHPCTICSPNHPIISPHWFYLKNRTTNTSYLLCCVCMAAGLLLFFNQIDGGVRHATD